MAKFGINEKDLNELSITREDKLVMIGDRKHDIIGANENEIDSIGVVYGYGTSEELIESNATHIVSTVDELKVFLSNE